MVSNFYIANDKFTISKSLVKDNYYLTTIISGSTLELIFPEKKIFYEFINEIKSIFKTETVKCLIELNFKKSNLELPMVFVGNTNSKYSIALSIDQISIHITVTQHLEDSNEVILNTRESNLEKLLAYLSDLEAFVNSVAFIPNLLK